MKSFKPTQATILRDVNGNKTVAIKKDNQKAFSIQTNGNLPLCHSLPVGERFEAHFNINCWKEILAYIKAYGTSKQKSLFDLTEIKGAK